MEVQQRLGGRYQLLSELGSGGMAVVWKAHDDVLNRSVAIKVLAGRWAGDAQSRARIQAEARAAATLSHPNIAQVYDYGEADDEQARLPYVVMELIDGPTLAQRLARGPVPPRAAFRIGAEVAAALAAAHAHGLVHRDVKPANVMVTAARAKVVDFGIAASAGPGRPDDELLGTPAYLAPERLLSDRVEPASDVYALGVLLYRMLANNSPWSVDTTTQMLDAHVYVEPEPMPDVAGVPADVIALVNHCLLKNSADRPTAAEIATILLEAADAPPTHGAGKAQNAPAYVERGAGGGGKGANAGSAAWAGALRTAGPKGGGNAAPAAGDSGDKTDNLAAPGERKRRRAIAAGGVAAAVVAAALTYVLLPAAAGGDNDDQAGGAGPSGRPGGTTAAALEPTAGPTTGPGPSAQPGGAGQAPDRGDALGASSGTGTTTGTTAAPASSGAAPPSSGAAAPGGTGSATAEPTSPSAAPSTSSAPADSRARRLTSKAGAVLARCESGKAELLEWEPQDPWKVEKVNAGPVLAATAVFKNKKLRFRMTVTCVAGVPTSVGLPI